MDQRNDKPKRGESNSPLRDIPGSTEKLLSRYERNTVVRSLLQLVPFGIGGAIDVALVRTVQRLRDGRSRAFFDELAKGNATLDPALLESEDFVHRFFATTKCALNTQRKEKIEMFARLLKASVIQADLKDADEYETFLQILDDLTWQELHALAILDSFSNRPRAAGQNDLQWMNTFWNEFEERVSAELHIPKERVRDVMNRIARTGCYEILTGSYLDYLGGRGLLTPTYWRLKKLINDGAAA